MLFFVFFHFFIMYFYRILFLFMYYSSPVECGRTVISIRYNEHEEDVNK